MAPDNSLFIAGEDQDQPYPGKVVHYSCRSQKVTDKEEVKEVSELKDGEVVTETTKTHHHEEQEDDEVPEDEVDETALPEVSKETTRNIEYYRDDDEFDSLSEKMRRERENNFIRDHSPSRRDPVTKKTLNLDEEEVIRNSETNRWLENHFGSESGSDVEETTKTTKAGGNVIKIQMTGSPRPTSRDKLHIEQKDTCTLEASKSRRRFQDHDAASHSRIFQDNRLSTNSISEVKDWHSEQKRVSSPLPRSTSPPSRRESTRSPPISGISAKQTDSVYRRSVPSPSKSPSKTYYLGDDNTYKRKHTKLEPTSLKRQSDGWKSTPSIRDDYYRSLNDEEKQKTHKQKTVRHEERSPERFVHRSHSQKDTPRSFTIYDGSKTSKETYFIGENTPVSQTLPRDTRFKGEEKTSRQNYNTTEVQRKHKNQKKSDLSVQVDLSDEESKSSTFPRKHSTSPFRASNGSRRRSPSPVRASNGSRRRSPSPVRVPNGSRRRSPSPVRASNGSRRISPSPDHISNDRTSKSLPRFSGKKSTSKEKEPKIHTSLNLSTLKTPAQTFYFGDEKDANYKTTKKKVPEGNQDAKLYGIEHRYSNRQTFNPNDHSFVSDYSSSPSYREGFFTIERDSGVTKRHSNFHSSMGDLRESSIHDFGRNADETFWNSRSHKKKTKGGHSSGINRVEEGSFRDHSDSYESNSFLNDKKSYYKNTHNSNIDISITPNKKQSGSEVKRHQFMQNLLGSSERDLTFSTDESDVYKNHTNRRQRTSRDMPPPLPKHLDSSTPPQAQYPIW
ncbi:serine/arginine repetitive matrix protein 1-like [Limulus polyphemus]|uniref:Serine/arginine repetitive matrix protein 1-like n=1 Tax=Limulus polyphemus TaxID=6850 RepID=A0ABM1C0F4_LIMPO|nr:serine/arginine repetitive matrix protein 1-like [Limulus polyphemus]